MYIACMSKEHNIIRPGKTDEENQRWSNLSKTTNPRLLHYCSSVGLVTTNILLSNTKELKLIYKYSRTNTEALWNCNVLLSDILNVSDFAVTLL